MKMVGRYVGLCVTIVIVLAIGVSAMAGEAPTKIVYPSKVIELMTHNTPGEVMDLMAA